MPDDETIRATLDLGDSAPAAKRLNDELDHMGDALKAVNAEFGEGGNTAIFADGQHRIRTSIAKTREAAAGPAGQAEPSRRVPAGPAGQQAEPAGPPAAKDLEEMKGLQVRALGAAMQGTVLTEKTQVTVAMIQAQLAQITNRLLVLDREANKQLQHQQQTRQNNGGNP